MLEKYPVVLIGYAEGGGVGVVGLYENSDLAKMAVQRGHMPPCVFYSVMTPALNGYVVPMPAPLLNDTQPRREA